MSKLSNKLKQKFTAENIIETIKSFLIASLFICTVVLVCVYVSREGSINKKNRLSVNGMMVIRDNEVLSEFDKSLIMPDFIGFKSNGKCLGTKDNVELASDLYEILSECLCTVLGSDYECRKLDENTGLSEFEYAKSEKIWLYAEFPCSVPTEFIYAFCSEKNFVSVADTANGDYPYIDKIMLVFIQSDNSEMSEYYGLGITENGEFYKFTPSSNISEEMLFDTDRISAYNDNVALTEFKFAGDVDFEYEKISGIKVSEWRILCDTDNLTPMLKAEKYSDSDNEAFMDNAVSFFNCASVDAATYYDGDTLVYLGENGTLKISADSKILYASDEQNGISVSEYLMYENYSGSYGIFEVLMASQKILGKVSDLYSFPQNGITLKLSDVSANENNILFKYGYYYNNIPIVDENGNTIIFAEIEISDGKLIGIKTNMLRFSSTENNQSAFPTLWGLKQIFGKSDENADIQNSEISWKLVYRLNSDGVYEADNIILFDKQR